MNKISIGTVGTAKNTGKTTTLMTLLKELEKKGVTDIGLTSIGYDGESFDNVTGLPKPRIYVQEGMFAAVADRCLKYSRAKTEILLETDILIPLGRIVVCKITAPGKLVLAGPTKKSDLRKVLSYLYDFGASLNIIDGALGRVAPFTEADGLILSTGAARNSDISALALESKHMFSLLNCPLLPEKGKVARFGSVLSDEGCKSFVDLFSDADTMVVEGLLSGRYIKNITEAVGLTGKRLLFSDPLKLLIMGDISKTYDTIRELQQVLEVGVQKPVRVISATVNPYYPKYRYKTEDYEAAYVDKIRLRDEIGKSVGLQCHDVVENGGGGLLADVMRFWEEQADV